MSSKHINIHIPEYKEDIAITPMDYVQAIHTLLFMQHTMNMEIAHVKGGILGLQHHLDNFRTQETMTLYNKADKPKNARHEEAQIESVKRVHEKKLDLSTEKQLYEAMRPVLDSLEMVLNGYRSIIQAYPGIVPDDGQRQQIGIMVAQIQNDYDEVKRQRL